MAKHQKGKNPSVAAEVLSEDGCPTNVKKCKSLGKRSTCSKNGTLCQKINS